MEYIAIQGLNLYSKFLMSQMTKVWKQPMKAQEAFLQELIARDRDTEYGKRYLSGIKTLQEFRNKHPLTKYDHYEEHFKRLANGEEGVCVGCKVDRFGISSGTTGKGKLIPVVASNSAYTFLTVVLRRLFKLSPVQKRVMLYCRPARKFTKSGLAIAPIFFLPENTFPFMEAIQVSPGSALLISTDFEATYIHLLFGLVNKNINMFFAPFASQVHRALKMLEHNQDMFLEDLTLGRVNPRLNIDEGIRRSLDAALKADPARADELRREFARGFVGIVRRIWPHLALLTTIDISGYVKKFNATYAKCYRQLILKTTKKNMDSYRF